jgi:WD40 repeat protein
VRWPNICAWLANDRPVENPARDDVSSRFTRALLDGMGLPTGKKNLAACLQGLLRDPALKLRGFQAMGSVPPRLTLWSDLFGQPVIPPRPEIVLQAGHAGRVAGAVVTADGQHVVTAGTDSTVRVWSLKDRALLRVLTGHEVGVSALGLGSGDRWLVSGGGRPASGVLFHDLKDGARLVVPDQPHDHPLARVVMLPDGEHCVTVDSGARSVLWDLNATPPEPRPWLDKIEDEEVKGAKKGQERKGGKGNTRVNCLEVACGGDARLGMVAALCDDRSVRVFNASGAGIPVQIPWPDQPGALAVDTRGRRLAVGFDDGRVVVREVEGANEVTVKFSAGPITRLTFSPQGSLLVGHDRGLAVCTLPAQPSRTDPRVQELTDRPTGPVAFSPDGRDLAACDRNTGGLSVWRFEAGGPKRTLQDEAAGASALAITADGRLLVTGGLTGAVKTWPLGEPPARPSWSVPDHRAKVRRLSAAPSRRFLLIVNELDQALVWDLKERSCRRLPGAWTSGAFLGSDDQLVLIGQAGEGQTGRLVRVGLKGEEFTADPSFFGRPGEGLPGFETTAFEGLTLSPDGARVAAAAGPGQAPLVCVWDAKTGRLTHRIRPPALGDAVRCLSFSPEGRHLLTAGDSPESKLWDLDAGRGDLHAPAVTFRDPRPGARNVTAAVVRPGPARQVATGHRDGLVRLWTWREGQAEAVGPPLDLVQGVFSGEVKGLTFGSDGRDQFLAASGDGTSLWLARMSEPRPTPVADLGERPHHVEQINALIAWPPAPGGVAPGPLTLVSGSDDTTVKFWEVRDRALRLRGTFAAAGGRDEAVRPAGPARPAETDWVVYTPDGLFDASARGRELIRLRHTERARAMEQLDDTRFYTFDLGERLLTSTTPDAGAGPEEPPPIAIELPGPVDPGRADARLTITLGSDELQDVRLYHNNVPVRSGLEAEGGVGDGAPARGGRITIPVRLVKGPNRFYAMATTARRGETFDSRSPEAEVDYEGPPEPGEGPPEPGRLHVVALGVGDYKRRRLKYAEHDARRLSEVLHSRGFEVDGRSTGHRIVRTNTDATADGVNKAFGELAREVKGRPQDTVVVFLAGHTGVFEKDQFCLLLPSYPFPAEAPRVAQARGGVVARGDLPAVDPRHLLPYALIEANLMRLDALNRLVIVDACQADAILEDSQVKAIRKWMEIKSRRARTSYLMATRRGEPAVEVDDLRHGLFTYVLLRGLGGDGVNRDLEPQEVARIALPDNADFDHNGEITTGELDRYSRSYLPQLASVFPLVMTRSLDEGVKRRGAPAPVPVTAGDFEQDLRLQGANSSFPLVPLPRRPAQP